MASIVFGQALADVRSAGLAAKASDIAVIAAWNVFEKQSIGKESDKRYEDQGRAFAKKLILMAYASEK